MLGTVSKLERYEMEEGKERQPVGPLMGRRSLLEVSKSALKVDFTGHKVWHDQGNRKLVLMKKNVFRTQELDFDAPLGSPINFIQPGKTLDVKFSLCGNYLAIQRSDTSIDIVDLIKATEVKLTCRSKRGNLILRGGMLWLRREACKVDIDNEPQTCICLVTRCGLEVFRLPNADRGEIACKSLGTVKHNVQCFWHLPDHHVLVLASGNGTEMRPYQFQGSHVPTKLGKFYLPKAPAHKNLIVAKLYDSIYCVEVDIDARNLNLYKIGRESTALLKTLELFTSNNFGISIVDNLVCVHNLDGRYTCMYDIAADTENPCTIPKPMFRAWQEPRDVIQSFNPVTVQVAPDAAVHAIEVSSCHVLVDDQSEATFAAVLRVPTFGVPKGGVLTHIDGTCLAGLNFGQVVDLLLEDSQEEITSRKLIFHVQLEQSATQRSTSDGVEDGQNGKDVETFADGEDPVMYAKSWVFLEPYWILDAKRGYIWKIELNLDSIPDLAKLAIGSDESLEIVEPSFIFRDVRHLYGFLLRRACHAPLSSNVQLLFGTSRRDAKAYGKGILLSYLRELLRSSKSSDLSAVALAFKIINDAYLKALRERASNPSSSSSSSSPTNGSSVSSSAANQGSAKRLLSSSATSSSDGGVSRQSSPSGSNSPSPVSPFSRKALNGRELSVSTAPSSSLGSSSMSSPTSLDSVSPRMRRSNLQQLLDDFRHAGQIALKNIRCYNGVAVVLQIDVFTWVFMPLIPEPEEPDFFDKCLALSSFLSEYIRSLQQHFIPIEKYMHELLAWLLITCGKEGYLLQLLQYHVPTDSKRLARTLLERSLIYEPFLQVALDMFYRLGHIDYVVRAMLERDELLSALTLLQKFPHFFASEQTLRSQSNDEPSQRKGTSSSNGPRVPPGTVLIRASELWCCALRIYEENGFETGVFAMLHSFFLSCDPWSIAPENTSKVAGSTGGPDQTALVRDSPLAKDVKDMLGGLDVLPPRILSDDVTVLRTFGFVQVT